MSDDRCGEASTLDDGTPVSCMLPITHTGNHHDNELMWDWPATKDRCPATTQTGFGVVRCQLPTGHSHGHVDQNGYTWVHPTCTDTIWVSDEIGTVVCSLGQGHTTDHVENTTMRALHWPLMDRCLAPDPEPVTSQYSSDKLAGANRDDLIHNLFKRVEQLEQTSADAGIVDDTLARLSRGLGEIERRMTALEGLVSGTELNRQFERLNGAICTVNGGAQERYVDVSAKLDSIWHVLAAMAPIIDNLKPPLEVICGATTLHGMDRCPCKLDAGHDGHHYCGTLAWPNHQIMDQEERASASPAPARCPSQFREGQCLGYAGHDGECTAVPGTAADYQLEEPGEFVESTHDRSSDGTPLEEPVQRMENNGPWDPDAEEGWKPLGYTKDGL